MNPFLVDGDEALSVAELPFGAVDDLLKVHDVIIFSLKRNFNINLVVVALSSS